MSTGERIPLAVATQSAAILSDRWGLRPALGEIVVGSVRRQRPDVADLEFVAIQPAGDKDRLFDQLEDEAGGRAGSLFCEDKPRMIEVVQGLNHRFLHARIRVRLVINGTPFVIPVEIYRFVVLPEMTNQGWVTLLRTGPTDFGIAFLAQWHAHQSIPGGLQASKGGWLVDAAGKPVSVATEAQAFEGAGMPNVTPVVRQEWIDYRVRMSRAERRELLR